MIQPWPGELRDLTQCDILPNVHCHVVVRAMFGFYGKVKIFHFRLNSDRNQLCVKQLILYFVVVIARQTVKYSVHQTKYSIRNVPWLVNTGPCQITLWLKLRPSPLWWSAKDHDTRSQVFKSPNKWWTLLPQGWVWLLFLALFRDLISYATTSQSSSSFCIKAAPRPKSQASAWMKKRWVWSGILKTGVDVTLFQKVCRG